MTRSEVKQLYTTVTRGGVEIITSPGKFEGEPSYAPAFWDDVLNGCACEEETEEDENAIAMIELTDEHKQEWPELCKAERVYLQESDQGFVYTWLA